MKKVLLVSVLLLAVLFSAFSADISLGFAQNYVDTSVIVDVEDGRFGVEASVGFPLVAALGSIKNGSDFEFFHVLLPGLMVNPYFKVVYGDRFQLRIGLQNDTLVYASKEDGVQAMGMIGLSVGFNRRFNESFSMNFSIGCPLGLPLSAISDDAASWTVYYFSSKPYTDDDVVKIILGGYGCAMNQFARFSCKWSLN